MEKMKFGFNRFALSLALFAACAGSVVAPVWGSYVTPTHITQNYGVPSGTVLPYVGTTAPAGFLMCDGTSYLRATYPTLTTALGCSGATCAYGAADTTHFNVPDFRGRFLRGTDNMGSGAASRDPGAGSRTAMATGGNTGNNVGSVQTDSFQGHWHDQWMRSDIGGATVGRYGGILDGTGANTSMGAGVNNWVRSPISDGSNGTPRTATETRPINGYVNYIVKI
jgi:microcystin-dependent protein